MRLSRFKIKKKKGGGVGKRIPLFRNKYRYKYPARVRVWKRRVVGKRLRELGTREQIEESAGRKMRHF